MDISTIPGYNCHMATNIHRDIRTSTLVLHWHDDRCLAARDELRDRGIDTEDPNLWADYFAGRYDDHDPADELDGHDLSDVIAEA